MYQDAEIEGGPNEFEDKSVHKDSAVVGNMSSAKSSTIGPVKTGKLGEVYIVYSLLYVCTKLHHYKIYTLSSIEVVCGNPKSKQHLVLPLPLALFHSVNCCPLSDAGTFAKRLLDVFFFF